MTLFHILAAGAFASAALYVLTRPSQSQTAPATGRWRIPALLCAAFTAWTIYTLSVDPPLTFWTNHTTNATGNQVWFDLLMSVSMAFVVLMPRARALNMALLPWAIFVVVTASIGLFAMWARVLFLEETQSGSQPV